MNIKHLGSQRQPAKRTRRFACLKETQSGGFTWLVVANRSLPYRSSSTIAMRHSSPMAQAHGGWHISNAIYRVTVLGRELVVGSALVA